MPLGGLSSQRPPLQLSLSHPHPVTQHKPWYGHSKHAICWGTALKASSVTKIKNQHPHDPCLLLRRNVTAEPRLLFHSLPGHLSVEDGGTAVTAARGLLSGTRAPAY